MPVEPLSTGFSTWTWQVERRASGRSLFHKGMVRQATFFFFFITRRFFTPRLFHLADARRWNAAKCKNLCPLSSCAYDRIPFVTSLEHSLFCLVFFSFLHFSFLFLFFFLFFIFLLCARSERRNNWFHPFFFRRDMLWILYKELEAR